MKKLVFYVFVTFCGLLNVSAGCSEKEEKAPEPDDSVLLGYWILQKGHSEWKKRDADQWVQKATIKSGVIAYEFLADKRFVSYDLTGKIPSAKGTWKLDVKSRDGKDIGLAYIYLYSDIFKDIASLDVLEKDGSMRFMISTEVFNGVQQLAMSTKEIPLKDEDEYTHIRNYMVFTLGK